MKRMKLQIPTLSLLASFLLPFCKAEQASEALASRTYFYIGGQYENVTQPMLGTGTVLAGQMYVEKLVPHNPTQEYPLIFVPGAGQTSTNFLNTPDGRKGWASYFLEKGYTIYLTDPPQRGRSPYIPGSSDTIGQIPVSTIERAFTAPEKFTNWPSLYPQKALHTQWPGTGLQGDPTFDKFYASQVQLQLDPDISDRLIKPALNALLDKVGPSMLIVHSQSGPYGFVAADSRPSLVKALIAIEPEGPPFVLVPGVGGKARNDGVTRLPLLYSPPVVNISRDLKTVQVPPPSGKEELYINCTLQAEPPRLLVNVGLVPVVLVTGEASYHAPYDWCTIEFLKQAGVRVTWLDLGSLGVRGNGHFPFLEMNLLVVADLVLNWIRKTVTGGFVDQGADRVQES